MLVYEYSDAYTDIYRGRNKLWALAEKYEKEGKLEKANNIRVNNLGTKKLDNTRRRFRAKVRNLLCKAAHQLMDRACVIVVEDLTGFIKSKNLGRKTNRRLGIWVKGVMQDILEEIAALRDVRVEIVNGAYTSQTDSQTGVLSGERKGDRFYRDAICSGGTHWPSKGFNWMQPTLEKLL